MSDSEQIRQSFQRNVRALQLRSNLGQGTAQTRVRVNGGLTCTAQDGQWTLTVDLSKKSGGQSQGPDPGVLGRSALGSCLAMAYTMWATQLKVPINSLQVEIQADYDSRGMYGVDGVAPGYSQVRYTVCIDSPASEKQVHRVIESAEAHCPYLQIFREPVDMVRTIQIRNARRSEDES